MDTEDTPSILTVSTCLLAEVSAEATIEHGEFTRLEPFLPVKSADGLLRGSDEVLLIDSTEAIDISCTLVDVVKRLVEVAELSGKSHASLAHEEGGLHESVAMLVKEVLTVGDDSTVELNTPTLKEVSTMTSDLDTTLGISTVDHSKKLVMVEGLLNTVGVLGELTPLLDDGIISLILADRHALVDDVANGGDEGLDLLVLGGLLLAELGNLSLSIVLLLEELLKLGVIDRLTRLLSSSVEGTDLLLDGTNSLLSLVQGEAGLSPGSVELEHLIDDFDRLEAALLALTDHIRVLTEILDVKSHVFFFYLISS